jgi:hypothetical protein
MRTAKSATALILFGLGFHFLPAQPALGATPGADCTLTLEDKKANADLSFVEFDQEGTIPSTARQLAMRGCYREAAEAMEDYLITGVVENLHQQRIMRFHLGQYLASAGDEREAAYVIAGTKNPEQPRNAFIDWNTYVDGTWAFLVKDRAILDASFEALSAASGNGNALDLHDLARLRRCFHRSYLDATTRDECAPE